MRRPSRRRWSRWLRSASMERLEFGSHPWCEALFDEMRTRLKTVDLADVTWSQCEEFSHPPAHLAREGADTIGWHIRIAGGDVTVAEVPAADVDLRVVVDYDVVLPVARMPYAGNPEAAERLRTMRDDTGRYAAYGDRTAMPAAVAQAFEGLHDVMVTKTR
jgi:hypothetical protein